MEQRVLEADTEKLMFISSFSAAATGAYRQVAAPVAQRCGAEKLHEYSGEGCSER